MYSLVLLASLSTGPEMPSFDGRIRDAIFGGTGSGCIGRDSRDRYDDRTSCGGCSGCYGSCHGIFGGRIRSLFSFRGCNGCGGGCIGNRDPRDRGDYYPPRDRGLSGQSATCHGYTYGSSCLGSTIAPTYGSSYSYGSSCYGSASLPSSSCFGLGLGSLTPSSPSFPQIQLPGGYATPTPAQFGSAPFFGSGDCFEGSQELAMPSVIGGGFGEFVTEPSIPQGFGGTYPGGTYPGVPEYPTIPSPRLPTTPPSVMPLERPAVPTPAPEVREERNLPSPHSRVVTVGGTPSANRATIHVRLPADGKLYAEGRLLQITNGEKTFTTPALIPDRDAVYTFRAEYIRDGEVVSQTKKVTVRAGGKATVLFEDLYAKPSTASGSGSVPTIKVPDLIAAKPTDSRPALSAPVMPATNPSAKPPLDDDRAKITVKVPSGATLFVDGKKNDRTDAVREFLTPPLKQDQDYAYVMRLEMGKGAYQELKVEFRAGMALTVDFTNTSNPVQAQARAGK